MLRSFIGACVAAAIAMAVVSPSRAASPDCAVEGGQLLSWPAGDPVWEMCWLGPSDSIGPRGSGLELRAIHYQGILVARRMHAPMLFAEYDNGSGGNCYRDWKDQDSPSLAHTSTHNQLGAPPDLSRLAATACSVSQHPTQSYGICPHQQPTGGGYECSSGQNVIIEDLGDHVRLVSQYRADWYMYDSRVSFYRDGDIEPVFGFGNHNGTFNSVTHWHHNYWRFDFDIDGESNVVSVNGQDRTTEFHDVRGAPGEKTWEVRNPTSGRGYRLVPGADDYTVATNESGRNFHTVDFMATRYQASQYGDNPNYNLFDCAMDQNSLVNGESIDKQDVVLWYRVAVRDAASGSWPPGCGGSANPCVPQDSMVCKTAGPRFEPIGLWGDPVQTADLSISLSAQTASVPIGGSVLLDASIANAGPQTVDEASVELELPDGVLFDAAIGDWDCDSVGNLVSCSYTGPALSPDASSALQVQAVIDATAVVGDAEIIATVESAQWSDPDTKNNVVSAGFEITSDPAELIFMDGFEQPSP